MNDILYYGNANIPITFFAILIMPLVLALVDCMMNGGIARWAWLDFVLGLIAYPVLLIAACKLKPQRTNQTH